MPVLGQIVNIVLSRSTGAVAEEGFGVPLIYSQESPPGGFSEDFRVYTAQSYTDDFSSGPAFNALKALFSQANTPEKCYVGFKLAGDTDDAAALTRINNADSSWYALIPVGAALPEATAKAISDWGGANSKLTLIDAYGADPPNAAETTDIGSLLKTGAAGRSAVFYNAEAAESLASAIAGKLLPTPPGNSTFAFQTLNGVTQASLTATQVTALDGKNISYFEALGGRNVTLGGRLADGEFIDIVRDTDWLVSRIRSAVLAVIVGKNKVPYTDAGIALIQAAVDAVLGVAVEEGVIDDDWTKTNPRVADVPVNDRAQRQLPSIDITCRLTGAIHSVSFSISVSV